MITATDISGRFWNLPQKADEETARETTFIDDIIQKTHIEREILSNLDGIRTVFDGGAGYGRFSILLAKLGLRVTHFDISEVMISKAKELAAEAGVTDNMTFIHGSLEDLSAYSDRQFDLVLSFDAPISYTYPRHEEVIGNLMRICSKRLIIGVYSRLGWETYPFNPVQKSKYILDNTSNAPLVQWYLESEAKSRSGFKPNIDFVRSLSTSGLMENPETVAVEYEKGGTPWPVSYSFMPDELQGLLERFGAKSVKLAGPGALSRSIPGEVLRNIMRDKELREDFLSFCYDYDRNIYVCGMGKDNVVATAEL